MQPNGANKNIVDHAIFSNEGPNLKSPADTKIPKVIPKIYKLKKRKNKYTPRSNIEIPNNGEVNKIAGIRPINALTSAVKIRELNISLIFSGAITDYSYGSFPFEDILPRLLSSGVPRDAIIHEKKSQNTREQAIEVINMAKANNWKKVILVATHEHQYRAYLTRMADEIRDFEFSANQELYGCKSCHQDKGLGHQFEQLCNENGCHFKEINPDGLGVKKVT